MELPDGVKKLIDGPNFAHLATDHAGRLARNRRRSG